LCEEEIDTSNWDFSDIYGMAEHYREQISGNIREEIASPRNTLGPRQLVDNVRSVLADDDIVALDNGLYKVWFARNYTTLKPNTLLLDNALATM